MSDRLPTRFRRSGEIDSVEALLERIGELVSQRQALRERGASREVLERNRRRIARCQWELCLALIERHLPRPVQDRAA